VLLEKDIERKFRQRVLRREPRAKVWKFVSTGMRGVPDRLVLLPGGRVVFAEIKKSGERPEPLQRKRAAELHDIDFPVFIIDGDEAIERFMTVVFG
jgi:hypothetical protein